MRLFLGLLATHLIVAFTAFGAAYALVDPRTHAGSVERALIQEFLDAYCQPDWDHSAGFQTGRKAAIVKVGIRAGLATVLVAERARCYMERGLRVGQ